MTVSSSPSSSTQSPRWPRHTSLKLNDGSVLPSPAFGLGTVHREQNITHVVLSALENGFRHLDNAEEKLPPHSAMYKNEEFVGQAIRLSGIPRDELFLTSKWGAIGGDDIRTELFKSLKKLGVSYLDLYLVHTPKCLKVGGGLEKVWREFEALKEEGLVRSIGVSNFTVAQLEGLLQLSKIKPSVNQIRLHVYNTAENASLIELCEAEGVVVEAFSSLSPITKFPGGPADAAASKIGERLALTGLGRVSSAQVILSWLTAKGIGAVTTSGNATRQKEMMDVFDDSFPRLTSEEIRRYEESGVGFIKPEVPF